MIDFKKLKIGNFISRKDLVSKKERFEVILELREKAITTGGLKVVCDYIDLFPIKITEEWLFKLGFEKMNYGIVSFRAAIRINDDGDKIFLDRFGVMRIYSNSDNPSTIELPHIKYIHQVQNLIDAISSKNEL